VRRVLTDLLPAATRSRRTASARAMRALRSTTAVDHERLERRLDIEARFASVASYRALLERLHGFYAPIEEHLAPFVSDLAGLDSEGRRKAGLLVEDLFAVGGTPRFVDADLPAIESRADALGTLYVLEGATLGGTTIQRVLTRRLGVTSSFFNPYERETGARWARFSAVLEIAVAETETDAAAEAARRCFVAMEHWLCG
jgi:heme oxygenase